MPLPRPRPGLQGNGASRQALGYELTATSPGVVEDHTEGVPLAARKPADSMAHPEAVRAARAPAGTVRRGKDKDLALLPRDDLAPRLRPRPLLDEEELTALVVDIAAGEEAGQLQREGDRAVEVAVQAVVAAGLVTEEERRRLRAYPVSDATLDLLRYA